MNNNYIHLVMTDRCIIERCMTFGHSLKETKKRLAILAMISHEIKKHRFFVKSQFVTCLNIYACHEQKLCGDKRCLLPCIDYKKDYLL